MIVIFVFTIIALLFTHYTLKVYNIRKKYAHIPGPPTKGLIGFYFGNFFEISSNQVNGKIGTDLILEWIRIYGKTIKYQLGYVVILVTVDQNAVKEILIEKNFPKNSFLMKAVTYPYGERFSGRGLFGDVDNLRWKQRRAVYNPSFHKQCLVDFINEFNFTSNTFLEKIRSLADGKTSVNMLNQFSLITLDIISHVAFGMDTDAINNPDNDLSFCISEAFTGIMNHLKNQFSFGRSLLPSELIYSYKYKKIVKKLRALGKDQLINRLKTINDGLYTPSDLLNAILKTSEENDDTDLEDMIDDFITFYFAGHETTANGLGFCILQLGKNPQILKKLREEIDFVLGSRNEVTNDDIINLKYLSCVIKETLRLWSPANGTVREINTTDFKIGNLKIPSGAIVHIGPYFSGRYEEYYPEPLKFIPERFENDNGKNAYAYLPFSLGPRNCIGQNFAKIEMKIILAKLIKNFDFKLVEDQNFGAVEHLTFKPIDGAKCYVSVRNF